MKTRKIFGFVTVTVFIGAMLFAGGCAPKSGSTQKTDMSDWEWVPSVWVNNSFSSGQYKNCSYDEYNDGYLCPPGTK